MILLIQFTLSLVLLSCGGNSAVSDTSNAAELAKPDGRFQLTVTIEGAANDNAKLLGVYGNQNFVADSAKANANGTFVF